MSKYSEDDMFLNYGKNTNEVGRECKSCKKLERKVGLKQNTINNLERELKDLKDTHWSLVGYHCKLTDELTAKNKIINEFHTTS